MLNEHKKNKRISNLLLVICLFVAQLVGVSIQQSTSVPSFLAEISEDELVDQIKSATTELSSIFNDELGIFVWNIQDPLNISRYGDLTEEPNFDETAYQQNDLQKWFDSLTQDIMMQYLFLKTNIKPALGFLGEDIQFTREWVFLTYNIVEWLYSIATNNQLISVLDYISESRDGFSEYWNTLIRPKYYEFLDENVALLPDTLALGTKILQAIDFSPHFSYLERYPIQMLSNEVNQWWNSINLYALFDPNFAIGGIDSSYIHNNYQKWFGWLEFTGMAYNETFIPVDITSDDYSDLQIYLYTSPQMALEYLTYINKHACGSSVVWNYNFYQYTIQDLTLSSLYNRIINSYAQHIFWVSEESQLIYDPRVSGFNWLTLENSFSGYSYVWSDYFIGDQDSNKDLYHYLNDLPLKITSKRTYQGPGDMRGLMDVFRVLSRGFSFDSTIKFCEDKALRVLEQILTSARDDGSFAFSPYFGTALDESLLSDSIIDDSILIRPIYLPDGLNRFTGTLTVMNFLMQARESLQNIGSYYYKEQNNQLKGLKRDLDNVLIKIGDLLLTKIDSKTSGILKETIVSNLVLHESYDPPYYSPKSVNIHIDLNPNKISIDDLPVWLHQCDSYRETGISSIYQWDYLFNLKQLYFITDEIDYIMPLFECLKCFNQDYQEDSQYQLTSICEGKDPVARTFFEVDITGTNIELNDKTGLFGKHIPSDYRKEVIPISSAFATETPVKISELTLDIYPIVLQSVLSTPMLDRAVLFGFISGIIMTIIIVYVKRPRNQ
jgi:hypothetical protein